MELTRQQIQELARQRPHKPIERVTRYVACRVVECVQMVSGERREVEVARREEWRVRRVA